MSALSFHVLPTQRQEISQYKCTITELTPNLTTRLAKLHYTVVEGSQKYAKVILALNGPGLVTMRGCPIRIM